MMTDYNNNDFRAVKVAKCRWDDGKGFEYSMTFPARGIYKSGTCLVAEEMGVRYASHRKGYRASPRAFNRFLAAYVAMLDNRALAMSAEAARARAELLPDQGGNRR